MCFAIVILDTWLRSKSMASRTGYEKTELWILWGLGCFSMYTVIRLFFLEGHAMILLSAFLLSYLFSLCITRIYGKPPIPSNTMSRRKIIGLISVNRRHITHRERKIIFFLLMFIIIYLDMTGIKEEERGYLYLLHTHSLFIYGMFAVSWIVVRGPNFSMGENIPWIKPIAFLLMIVLLIYTLFLFWHSYDKGEYDMGLLIMSLALSSFCLGALVEVFVDHRRKTRVKKMDLQTPIKECIHEWYRK